MELTRKLRRVATIVGMGLEIILVAAVSLWDWMSDAREKFAGRLALCGLFCLMPSFAPISWKSYYAAMLVPYMALTAALVTDRAAGKSAPKIVWTLFVLSVVLNLATGNYLNRVALFYSAHFISSLLALAAVFALWLHERGDREREAAIANEVALRSELLDLQGQAPRAGDSSRYRFPGCASHARSSSS